MTDEPNPEFEVLLTHLKLARGFDFTGYKRSSLTRRVERRMATVDVSTYCGYIDYLEVHPEEYRHLFDTILINVTAFFRDPNAWEYLRKEVIPRIIAQKPTDEPIRIWSAGCASGAEPYSLAMAFAEEQGSDEARDRLKIYATDIDESALTDARLASYSQHEVTGVPQAYLEKYFEIDPASGRYVFCKDLRRTVIFGRHDLMQDAPISRIDLLVCRNTLMYFNADAQERVAPRLHFSLNDSGYLLLGKAEMLFGHSDLFAPCDLKNRIFKKLVRTPRDSMTLAELERASDQVANGGRTRLRDLAFDHGELPQLVIDGAGTLTMANDRARRLFRVVNKDIGQPIYDLEPSYRPVDLHAMIEQAYSERRAVSQRELPGPVHVEAHNWVDVNVNPITEQDGALLGAIITFTDVSRFKDLQDDLRKANRALEIAHEELQSTNEELETTNEELQSMNEELETTNEELQSTNEELETTNEELQSTNEEIQTMNEELRLRSTELNHTSAFVASILKSMGIGLIVVDLDMHVRIWNHMAEEMWGCRSDEALGRHLLNLDIGLPIDELKLPIRRTQTGESAYSEHALRALNRRGKTIETQVTLAPLIESGGSITGTIILIKVA